MARLYPDAQPKKKYTVASTVKIGGEWRHAGALVHLTDAEAASYGHALEGGEDTRAKAPGIVSDPADGGPTLPGQEPQEPTPIPALMKAQAEAGDKLMEREVERRASRGARVLDGGDGTAYNARVMKAKPEPGEAYPPGGEPQEPTKAYIVDAEGEAVPAPEALTPLAEPAPPQAPTSTGAPEVVKVGGSWYEVRFADGRVEKVQGKEAAEKLAKG